MAAADRKGSTQENQREWRWVKSRVATRGMKKRETVRQGLLTGSDGYHFIRDTILRLPQPTSLPSPSSMPPTTDLIWSHPSHPDPPSTFYPPSFFVYYLTWSRRPLYLSREVFLTSVSCCSCFPPTSAECGSSVKYIENIFPLAKLKQRGSTNLKILIYSVYPRELWKHTLS